MEKLLVYTASFGLCTPLHPFFQWLEQLDHLTIQEYLYWMRLRGIPCCSRISLQY